MNTHDMFRRLGTAILAMGVCCSVSNAGNESAPQNDDRLLNNIDTLRRVTPSGRTLVPVAQLEAELETLWDWDDQEKRPLVPETVVSVTKNGCKTDGIYINGYGDETGQDRVFFYYSRPEKNTEKLPVYIELTGGGEPERSAWMAGAYQCAVCDVEWRGAKNRFRSKWAAGELGEMKALDRLRGNMAYHLVSGIRRIIDFAAAQPDLDMERLGCGGGSMGGYYTLLTAGVDQRVRFGMDELGAGFLAQTDSRLGQFELDEAHKAIWLKAFDPYTYAQRTHAQIIMNLSANDYFFWLGDGVENFNAMAGGKRICISPNFNHNEGNYGATKNTGMPWLPFVMGWEPDYPDMEPLVQEGATYRIRPKPGTVIKDATLYWSPGLDIAWPARYWFAVPAFAKDNAWQAEIPPVFAGLVRIAFANIRDEKGRTVSSLPMSTPGADPRTTAGTWWTHGQAWDAEAGPGAWRPVGPNTHRAAGTAKLTKTDTDGLSILPVADSKNAFSLVTGSVVLATGAARSHTGLRLELDAGQTPGELTVSLVQNFGAIKTQREFTTIVRYAQGVQTIDIPWPNFKPAADGATDLFPFDNLRLDGTRADGSPLIIRRIASFGQK